jgi:hypothetical protein
VSRAFSLTTLVGALEATAEISGAPPAWDADNDLQRELMRHYGAYRDALPGLPELRCWAKRTAQELNAILREKGFDIQLTPWVPSDGRFGTLSIIDIAVLWPQIGTIAPQIDGHPAFRLAAGAIASCSVVEGHEHPIVRLRTRTDDVVCIAIHDAPAGPFELVAAVATLRAAEVLEPRGYAGVVLPMVELDAQPDLQWLCGIATDSPSGPWLITEALQQIRFGMNQHGARAKEATALAVGRSAAPRGDYVVDAPFLVWFERDGVGVPLFQAHVSEDDWKDPGDFIPAPAGRARRGWLRRRGDR